MATTTSKEVRPTTGPPETSINDLRHLLEKYKDQIAMALPKHISAERMIRLALTAFGRTPLLAKCSATSICGALVQASILGLEPDGMSGEAFLIPYYNSKIGGYECQMQTGYKGIVKLARNTGEYNLIDAQPVHDNDEFNFQKGSETFWFHRWDPRIERGAVYGYWGGYTLKDGGKNFEFMSVSEIEAHRDQYSQGAYKKDRGKFVLDGDGHKILQGPWKDSPDWMYRKTPLIQALKLGPKSYQLRVAMTLGDQADAGMAQTYTDLPKELNPVPMDEVPGEITETRAIAEPKAREEGGKPAPENPAKPGGIILISDLQARRLEQIAEESGWRERELLAFLKKDYAVDSVHDIRCVDYEHVVEILRTGGDPDKS
jgi:recombination protein RecT